MPYIIDPKTGKKIEIDPITGQPVQSAGMSTSDTGIFNKPAAPVVTPEQKTQENIEEYTQNTLR